MARRRTPRPLSAPAVPSACPCGVPGAPYAEHCGRFHAGRAAAPTAEALMRSRYSAFAVRDEAYLLRTWHPGTRPARVATDPGTRWTGLEIEETRRGSAFHQDGTVTYRAHYLDGREPGSLHERSRFTRVDGEWVYVDGDFLD
ncbi:YchJ family protein [Streptomyces sp. NPDC007088]|uniref:YchJ family protein n=1 Tax=Streptomyces sp. NPDC007088 TaxID=3364773 RepID=UPI00367E49B4